jgi:probable HAF family extracellular repeat protein
MIVTPDAPNSIRTILLTFLNDQPGGPEQSAANDLNSIGQVVGWADFAESAAASHAFLWNPSQPNYFLGSLFDLGDLPGGDDRSIAHGINSRGQVVGEGSVESGPHTFLWSPTAPNATSGTMIDLGDLVGSGGVSSARDINSRGIVVGHSGSAGEERAFVWMPTAPNGATGTMIDLNTLLDPVSSACWTLKFAEAINDFGQIVGNGLFDRDGPGRAPRGTCIPSNADSRTGVHLIGRWRPCAAARRGTQHEGLPAPSRGLTASGRRSSCARSVQPSARRSLR